MSKREKVKLVDINDNVIGEKWRDKLKNDDCWRIVSIWITNNEGKILLQQRSFNKKVAPGVWTAAAEGTVDSDDDYKTTAQRETEEEIGLADLRLKKVGKYYGPWGGFGKRQCQGYKALFNGTVDDLKIQVSEVNDVRWFTLEEVDQLRKNNPELFPLYDIYVALKFISS